MGSGCHLPLITDRDYHKAELSTTNLQKVYFVIGFANLQYNEILL